MTTPPAPRATARTSGVRPLGCLAVAIVGIVILLVLLARASNEESARRAGDPMSGKTWIVQPDCALTIYRDTADVDAEVRAWNDPQAVKDGAPAILRNASVRAGRAWIPSPGTHVRFEDRRPNGDLVVQIVDGIHAGHVGRPFSDRCLG
jgi:hypothetical protein